MAAIERGIGGSQEGGHRPGFFARLRNRPTALRTSESTPNTQESTGMKDTVIFSQMVPAADWDGLIRKMEDASRGKAPVSEAERKLVKLGIKPHVSIGRAEHELGKPYKLQPNEGVKPPIAIPMPDGDKRVLLTIDRARSPKKLVPVSS